MDNYSSTGLRPEDWERIVDILPDGIYVTNARGLTIKVNAAYEHMTGLSARQLVGRYIADIVKEGILSNSITQRVIDKGSEVTAEQTTAKGKRLALHGIPIYKSGSIILVVTIVKDITVINELGKELDHSRQIVNQYKSRLNELEGSPRFVAESPQFQAAVALAHKVAEVDSTVLILGESGTGKEVLAREIYQKSYRRDQPFLKINCGAIPDNLLESELFGYEEGAFTGAKKGGKPGKFQLANHGTLFLDEIGDMPLPLQVKILRALQEREIEKVGGGAPMPVDVRVISATRQDLPQMMAEGSFREDLYYRLAVINMETVPLRERPGDILLHANYYLDELNKKYKTKIILSDPVKCCLRQYNWPGNVRELQNVITGAYASCDNLMVEPADLPAKITALHKYDPGLRRQSSRLADTMDAYESAVIREALCRNGQNVKAAAEELGVERSLLYKKMKRLQIVIQRSIH